MQLAGGDSVTRLASAIEFILEGLHLSNRLNKSQTEPYTHGDGYGHVAVCVDDVKSEHQRFQELDLEPKDVVEFNRDGALMARFFFVQDPDGYKIEVLERHGRYR